MQAKLGTVLGHLALGAHGEGLAAANTELVFTLWASQVHAPSLGQGVTATNNK